MSVSKIAIRTTPNAPVFKRTTLLPLTCYEDRSLLSRNNTGTRMMYEMVQGGVEAFMVRVRRGEVHMPQEKNLLARYVRAMHEAKKEPALDRRMLAALVAEGAAMVECEVVEAVRVALTLHLNGAMIRLLVEECKRSSSVRLEEVALLFVQEQRVELYFDLGGKLVRGMVIGVAAAAHVANTDETNLAFDQLIGQQGADIHERDGLGNTPLHRAMYPLAALTLLQMKADPNQTNEAGRTPLHTAPSAEIATMLLEFEASITARDVGGRTPFGTAVSEGVREVLRRADKRIKYRGLCDRTRHHIISKGSRRVRLAAGRLWASSS
jgi:hypothetical protein